MRFALAWVLAGWFLFLPVSCVSSKPAVKKRPVRTRVLGWKKFSAGPHRGYIRTVGGGAEPTHEVYDSEMRMIGFYTTMGSTYRTPPGKDAELLGKYDPQDSLRALHGIQSFDVEVQHLPMDPPLTLEKLREIEKRKGSDEP